MTNAEVFAESLKATLDYENSITCWVECPSCYLDEEPCDGMTWSEMQNTDICHLCKLEWLQSEFKEF